MSNSPIVVTNADQLSNIADAILKRVNVPGLTKPTLLNIIASEVCGPKHNWGFIKTSSELVFGQGLSPRSLGAPSAPSASDERAPEFLIRANGIMVRLYDRQTGEPDGLRRLIKPDEVVRARAAFFPEDEDSEPKQSIAFDDISLVVEGDMMTAYESRSGGAIGRPVPLHMFRDLIENNIVHITNALAETAKGSAVHGAFVVVAEGDMEIADLASEADDTEAFEEKMNAACLAATRVYFEGAAFDFSREFLLRTGSHHEIVNDIIDRNWIILLDQLDH